MVGFCRMMKREKSGSGGGCDAGLGDLALVLAVFGLLRNRSRFL